MLHRRVSRTRCWVSILILTTILLFLFATPALAQGEGAGTPDYRTFPVVGSRVALWIVAQVMLMFAAFVLAIPMFAVVVEFIGWRTDDLRYDRLAREFTKLLLIAFSTTAILGATMTFFLISLYPSFTNYLTGIFMPTFVIFPLLFFGEAFTLYLYWYSWDRLMDRKGLHIFLGILLNVFGTIIMFIANAWATFMISPAGVDQQGNLTSLWDAINNPTWMALNIHRLIANAAFGGAIVGAYAAFKFLNAKNHTERAHYDWMGYVGNFIAVASLLPLPFAGYWFGREIYGFNQQMGITMMGGFLSWLWIIQALLIGVLFLAANYYLWLGMGRIDGAERYMKYIPYLLVVLTLGVLVWATPHSLVASLEEARRIGAAHHPLLGVLGVMSAKNTAVNIMILTTFVSFLLYRRAGKGDPPPFAEQGSSARIVLFVVAGICALLLLSPLYRIFATGISQTHHVVQVSLVGLQVLGLVAGLGLTFGDRGKVAQALIVGIAALVVVFLGVYGYRVEAIVRIGFSIYQVLAVLSAMIAVTAIDVLMFRGARTVGKIRWGEIPHRAQYALFLLAVTFTWLMGLMGYARNGIRQHWHVFGVVRDTSEWAFSPPLGFVANVISICVIIFLSLIAFIFWIGELGMKPIPIEEPEPAPPVGEAVPVPGNPGREGAYGS